MTSTYNTRKTPLQDWNVNEMVLTPSEPKSCVQGSKYQEVRAVSQAARSCFRLCLCSVFRSAFESEWWRKASSVVLH